MDFKPQPAFKGNSYGYKKKRCLWFNSAFMDDITFADGKIIDMTFNVPPFQIYNPNNLKVICYIRDDTNTKPIVIKMKEPYLTNRSVLNTDKEGFPLIYCNHTGVEGMTSMSPKYLLSPQQISRFVFKIDESLNNRDGLTVNETIVQTTTTLSIKSSEYSINYEPFKHIKSGTYTATFSGGNINFNGITDTSYPLLKDGSGITINPYIWYKFDGYSTLISNDEMGRNNLTNNNVILDTTNFIKGNGSAGFPSSIGGYFTFNNTIPFHTIQPATGLSISFWQRGLSTSAGYAPFFFFANSAGAGSGAFYIRKAGSGTGLEVGLWRGGYETVVISGNFFDGSWKHITWTISTTGVWVFYVNGTNQNITMTSPFLNSDYTTNVKIMGATANDFYGNIDDFRIYDRVLTATQVNELYKGRLTIYNAPSFELAVELEDTNLTKDNIVSIYR